jgi:hypothetical protein
MRSDRGLYRWFLYREDEWSRHGNFHAASTNAELSGYEGLGQVGVYSFLGVRLTLLRLRQFPLSIGFETSTSQPCSQDHPPFVLTSRDQDRL